MLFLFFQDFFSKQPLFNLFHYISFRAVVAAIFAFIFVVAFMPSLIRFFRSRSMKQIIRDDGPHTHSKKTGTPTMGGLLMVGGIFISSLLFCRLENIEVWISLFILLSFGFVGFLDDYLKLSKRNTKGVSSSAKLLSLGFFSCVAIYLAMQEAHLKPVIEFPFLKEFAIPLELMSGLLFYIWGFLVMTGASNAVNLTDGLDGLAIVPVMTSALVLLITSYVSGHSVFANYLQFHFISGAGELSIVTAAAVGVGLGFLWYNAHPAQIFMGDVGSLSLGGLLGAVALLTHKELIFFIAGFLFVIEALSVMIQVFYYKRTKRRVFRMAPIHHHFELAGWHESQVIVRFWILSILFAFLALSTLKIR